MISFRKPTSADYDAIWAITQKRIANGDAFVFAPSSTKEKMLNFWIADDRHTYVVEMNTKVVGVFFIKDNQPDLGSHIANGAYMVCPESSGLGIGTAMGKFSIELAIQLGYLAMQFNIVVKTNTTAVKLWQKLGFRILTVIPNAFRHSKFGLTDAYIMYLDLQ